MPDPDRQKVIDALGPLVMKGGDPTRGKAIFVKECAKCHTHTGEGGKVGPDLTGMAVHPREELIVHLLDPSRSVEGNYVLYTLATVDGRTLNGLLASETKTSVELIDAEGKSHTVARDEIDELAASKKSLMPEGFEKQVTPEGFADLLAFLTRRGKYLPLDLRKAATVVSTRGMFFDGDNPTERLILADWAPKTIDGVPFIFVDPRGDRDKNAILLNSRQGTVPPKMPRTVSIDCRAPAKAIHILGGVGGWAFPYGEKGTVSMIVRLHYADGKVENHPLLNGVHIADYIRRVDVPESKFAIDVNGRQLRSITIIPERASRSTASNSSKGATPPRPSSWPSLPSCATDQVREHLKIKTPLPSGERVAVGRARVREFIFIYEKRLSMRRSIMLVVFCATATFSRSPIVLAADSPRRMIELFTADETSLSRYYRLSFNEKDRERRREFSSLGRTTLRSSTSNRSVSRPKSTPSCSPIISATNSKNWTLTPSAMRTSPNLCRFARKSSRLSKRADRARRSTPPRSPTV